MHGVAGVEQGHDHCLGFIELLFSLCRDVDVLRHVHFLFRLMFLPLSLLLRPFSPHRNLAPRVLLELFVVAPSGPDDQSHEVVLWVLVQRNRDASRLLLGLVVRRGAVPRDGLDGVLNQRVVLGRHRFLGPKLPGVRTVSHSVVCGRRRRGANLFLSNFKFGLANLHGELFQALFFEKLLCLSGSEAFREVNVGRRDEGLCLQRVVPPFCLSSRFDALPPGASRAVYRHKSGHRDQSHQLVHRHRVCRLSVGCFHKMRMKSDLRVSWLQQIDEFECSE
mmetsp:Transcript_55290/g.108182  ORF Transcript_55290/g.108182 Transcript_55290/m.108182 type:complete len:278 (-) Transcript_55290:35-868(-)